MIVSPATIYGTVAACIVGLAINQFALHLSTHPHYSKHPFYLKFTGTRQPMWCWFISGSLSGVIYPTLYALAIYSSQDRHEWLNGLDTRHLSSSGADLQYFRYFFYIFFGYLVRDLQLCDNPLFWAHHFACMGGILTTLETTSPGAISGTHGIIILELGSFYFNVWSIDDVMKHNLKHFPWWPQWQFPFISYGYYILFTLSNVVSGYFLYHSVMASFEGGYLMFGWWGLIAGIPLLLIRQHEVNKAIQGINPKPTMIKSEVDASKWWIMSFCRTGGFSEGNHGIMSAKHGSALLERYLTNTSCWGFGRCSRGAERIE